MGLLSVNPELETFLDAETDRWRMLSDKEYRDLIRRWRETFEAKFHSTDPQLTGQHALAHVESQLLPASGFVFQVPGYRYGPASASRKTAFAYEFEQMSGTNHDLLNWEDAILVDADMTWCCFYTHEAGALAQPAFYLAQ